MKTLLHCLPLLVLCLLSACSQKPPYTASATINNPTAENVQRADNAEPRDAALAALYNRSCRTCHGVDGMNAPLTLHTAAWQARFDERGAAGMLNSAKNGYQTMPAMGLCNDCNDADFDALIQFMSYGD